MAGGEEEEAWTCFYQSHLFWYFVFSVAQGFHLGLSLVCFSLNTVMHFTPDSISVFFWEIVSHVFLSSLPT